MYSDENLVFSKCTIPAEESNLTSKCETIKWDAELSKKLIPFDVNYHGSSDLATYSGYGEGLKVQVQ